MSRILVIGDIHGCSSALQTLLAMIALQAGDTLVTLGDYVDRGSDSKGVIDCLISLDQKGQLIPLKGNHELMMLEAKNNEYCTASWLQTWGKATVGSYTAKKEISLEDIPDSHWDFLENHCLDWWESEHHIFVHANLDPHLPLTEQSLHTLFWRKFYQPQPHDSGKIMVCGHTSQKDGLPISIGYAICIDTWVYGEGWLTALDVYSGELFQANQLGEKRTANIARFQVTVAQLEILYRFKRTFEEGLQNDLLDGW